MAANVDGGRFPETVEEIFLDYKGRRAGIIKALDTDLEDLYKMCDPEGKILCLYGLPNEQWEVKLMEIETPPEIPTPSIGINLARGSMEKYEWNAFVAIHSDSWLLSMAFFFGATLDKTERKRLFDMINDLPTVFEALFPTKLKPLGPWTSLRNSETDSKEFRCGACGEKCKRGEFWIRCRRCGKWFHSVCVNVSVNNTDQMKNFWCPPCRRRSLQR